MARLYAQLCSAVFLLVGIGGLFAGNAVSPRGGGDIGGLTLHLTWARDALDILLLVIFGFVGFIADRHLGRLVTGTVGVLLCVIGVAGFMVGDDAGATRGFLGLHFTTALNVLDLVVGILAVLAALGTVEDPEPPQRSVLRG